MPGGSVNGRPFRESSDSYSRTGIPCGNPKRFHSHEVVRMEPGKRTGPRPIDGPVEEIETQGQKHLQALLQKQLNTKISLQQHYQNKKEFSSSTLQKPGVEELSGVVTLSDYQTLEKTDSYIEEMKGYGLTEEEILLKLQHEEAEITAAKRSRLSNPDHDRSRLLEIERKIQTKQETLSKPDTFSNVKSISRHEMQLEKSISQSSQSSKFLHGILINEKSHKVNINPADPMNNLQDIMETITYKPHKHKHKRHRKDDSYKLNCTLECCTGIKENNATHLDEKCDKCDSVDVCPIEHRQLPVATCMEKPPDYKSTNSQETNQLKSDLELLENKVLIASSDERQNKMDNVEKKIHINDEDIEAIPEHVIMSYKLSAREIKKLPRFENYDPGEPNNVLFLKNLGAKVTREDLVALFNRYQKHTGEEIDYKLMTGRMKGQAFITFQNTETARKALELVHGYDFKGKPIIIVYGKKSTKY